MKKLLALIAVGAMALSAFTQDSVKKDTAWRAGGLFAFTLSQTGFTNWAAGGENSYSINGRLGLFANYTKNKVSWDNNLTTAYGKANQGNIGLRKTDDILELNSKFGYKNGGNWYYSVVLNMRTQMDDGYKYSNVDTIPDLLTSEFMAPFYLNLALGMDYKPDKYSSLFISPLNMKNTYVYDVKYAPRYSIDSNQHLRSDLGTIIKFRYEREFAENLNFLTKLDLFANYKEFNDFRDVDVDWEVVITMNVFKVLSFNFNTHFIWDKDVKFIEPNGLPGKPRGQFKEIIGAGLAYKF
jgi:hypothetical protein